MEEGLIQNNPLNQDKTHLVFDFLVSAKNQNISLCKNLRLEIIKKKG
jgi:hypothetical protein